MGTGSNLQSLIPGDILQDRWEVLQVFDLPWARGAAVRDKGWNEAVLDMIISPEGDEEAFSALAKRWRELNAHRNVLPGYYTLEVRGRPCLFVDHPPGRKLDSALAEPWRRIEHESTLLYAAQIAAGLTHIHGAGHVHGHVEPASCALADRYTLSLSRLQLGGKPISFAYRAPELWGDDTTPTQAADIYAFGVILHELFTRRRPFDVSAQVREHWSKIVEQTSGFNGFVGFLLGRRYKASFPPPLIKALKAATLKADTEVALMRHFHTEVDLPGFEVDVGLPPEFREIIAACLEKDPASRPKAPELLDYLEDRMDKKLQVTSPAEIEAAVSNQAVALAEMGEVHEAARVLDTWLERHPGDAYAWVNRALLDLEEHPERAHDLEERFDTAVRRFNPTIDQDPEIAGILEQLRFSNVGDEGSVRSISVRADGQSAAVTWSSGARVCLWGLREKRGTRILHVGSNQTVNDARLVVGGRVVVRAGDRIGAYWTRSARIIWSRVHATPIDAFTVSETGEFVAVASSTEIQLSALETGEVVRQLRLTSGSAAAMAIDADDRWLAVALEDAIFVLGTRDGAIVRRIELESAPHALDFVPDADALVFAIDGEVRRLDVRSGQVDNVAKGEHEAITAMTCSTDGALVATGDAAGKIVISRVADGSTVRVLENPGGSVTALAFLPGTSKLIVGDESGFARTWSVEKRPWSWLIRPGFGRKGEGTGTIGRNIREQSLLIQEAGLSFGIILAPTGTRLDWTTSYKGAVTAVAFSRDAQRAGVSERHAVHLSEVKGRRVHLDRLHLEQDNEILCLGFNAQGTRIVAGTGRWRGTRADAVQSLEKVASLTGFGGAAGISHRLDAGGVTIGRSPECGLVLHVPSSSRRHCIIEYEDGIYVVRDLGSANGIRINGIRIAEAVLRDGDVLGIGEVDLRFRSGGQREEGDAVTVPVPPSRIAGAAEETKIWRRDQLNIDFSTLTIDDDDDDEEPAPKPRSNAAVIWDSETGEALHTLQGHEAPVCAVAFTHDGSRVVTVSEDGSVVVWDAGSGELVRTLAVPTNVPLTSVAISPDDRWILSGRDDGKAVLWDLHSGQLLKEFSGHRLEVLSVTFSSDGRLFATGSRDGTARLWRSSTGEAIATCKGHTGAVTAVAFSPDDRLLLTGSLDGTALLWSRWDGQSMHKIELKEGVTAIAFSGDGRLLLTGGEDGTVQAWLMKCLCIYLAELVGIIEKVVDDPSKGSSIWAHKGTPDLDFWLDVWRDLRRCGEAEDVSPQLRERYHRVRTRVLYQVVEWLRAHGAAPKLSLGPTPASVPDGSQGYGSPYLTIEQAAPELAAQVRMHLAGGGTTSGS